MTLLVFGATGQVGLDIQRQVGPDAPFLFLGRDRADLTDPEHCAEMIRKTRPAVVINAAGCNDASADAATAHLVNVAAPGAMAVACAERKIPFIHISTAEVFDGSGEEPWQEGDVPAPKTDFGRSKFAGEEAIRAAAGPHAILRTSWVISAHRSNILKDMLTRAEKEARIEVASNVIAAPTPAYDLGRACLLTGERLLEDKSLSGTYHYQGMLHVTLDQVAEEVIAQAGLNCEVLAVRGSNNDVLSNARLDGTRTSAILGIKQPRWQAGVSFILNDLGRLLRK